MVKYYEERHIKHTEYHIVRRNKMLKEQRKTLYKEIDEWAENHYWDTFQKDKSIILLYLKDLKDILGKIKK